MITIDVISFIAGGAVGLLLLVIGYCFWRTL